MRIIRSLIALGLVLFLTGGCAAVANKLGLSEREVNAFKGTIGGTLTGASIGFAFGNIPGAIQGAAVGGAVGSALGAIQPVDVPYYGTVVVRNPEPPPRKVLLAYLYTEGESAAEFRAALIKDLRERGWRIFQGIGRPSEATLFSGKIVGNGGRVEILLPDGRFAEGFSEESVSGAVSEALERLRE